MLSFILVLYAGFFPVFYFFFFFIVFLLLTNPLILLSDLNKLFIIYGLYFCRNNEIDNILEYYCFVQFNVTTYPGKYQRTYFRCMKINNHSTSLFLTLLFRIHGYQIPGESTDWLIMYSKYFITFNFEIFKNKKLKGERPRDDVIVTDGNCKT